MDKQNKSFLDHICERSRNLMDHFSPVAKKAFQGKSMPQSKYLETFKVLSDCGTQFANLIGLTEDNPIEGIDHDSLILTLEMMGFTALKVDETLDHFHDLIRYQITVGITDSTGEFVAMDYKVFAIKHSNPEFLELRWKLRNAALPYLFYESEEEDDDDSDGDEDEE